MLKSKSRGVVVRTQFANWNPETKEWMIDGDATVPDPNGDYELLPDPPKVTPTTFKFLFSVEERIAIKTSTDPVIEDFYDFIQDMQKDPNLPKVDLNLETTAKALGYLVEKGVLTADRMAEILTGVVK